MRLIQLPMHLTPEQALTVIEVLDLLQSALWNHYGEGIEAALRPDTPEDNHRADDETVPDFEDPIPF